MKNIKLRQYEKVRELYQDLIRHTGRDFRKSDVDLLYGKIMGSTSALPVSGQYRAREYQPIDTKSFNTELGLIKVDIEVIFEFLSDLQYEKREIDYIIATYQNYLRNKIAQTNNTIANINSGKYRSGITLELPFQDYINDSLSSVSILDDVLTLPISLNRVITNTYHPDDISVQRIGAEYNVRLYGEPVDVLNLDNNNGLKLTLTPQSTVTAYEESGFHISFKTRTDNANCLFLRFNNNSAIKLRAEIESNNNRRIEIFNNIINHSTIDIPFTPCMVYKVHIYISLPGPNKISSSSYYEFNLSSIRLMNSVRHQESVFISKEVVIDDDVTSIQLVALDETIGSGNIKYYLSDNTDINDIPTAFLEVFPHNEENRFNLLNRTIRSTIQPDNNIWRIKKDPITGNRLYNILDCGISEDFGNITITDGIITTTDIDIIQDTVKLYTGIDNYRIEEEDRGIEYHIPSISYTTIYNEENNWIEDIPLRFYVESEPVSNIQLSGESFDIETRYPVNIDNRYEIRLTNENNELISATLTDIDENIITFSGEISDEDRMYISYVTSLKERFYPSKNIEIDYNSFIITADENDLLLNWDYKIHITDDLFSIEILKTGILADLVDIEESDDGYINHTPRISISYKMKAFGQHKVNKFITNILAASYSQMRVIPFTSEEIAAGNFHMLNGINVSSERTVTLKPGWNTIITTQPYPTLYNNSVDVNQLTKVPSAAGIIIPEDIQIMRAYKDSMRQVSSFMLSVLNNEDHDCFSIEDGKVYLNYLPEYIDQKLLDQDSYTIYTGNRYLCKKGIYGADYKNIRYESVPEMFLIEFAYKGNSESKKVYVKIELSSPGTDGNCRVHKIGLNTYKGDNY